VHLVGAHVETVGGVHNAPGNAHAIGCRSFALFTKNQRRWAAPPLTPAVASAFEQACAAHGYPLSHVAAHDSYLVNLGHPEADARKRSLDAFIDEMQRCEMLGIPALVMHPGSHLRLIDENTCLATIAHSINAAHAATASVSVLVETTAGQGSNVGYRFEHLARIINEIDDTSRVGVCLDTCHVFAAGFDIRTRGGLETMLEKLDTIVGLRYLRACHLNDSRHELGSRKDRHACIGEGALGIETFRAVMNEPRLAGMPLILETPLRERWADEIRLLYSLADQDDTQARGGVSHEQQRHEPKGI
jgi:deoxyribonuclease IV